MPFTGSLPDVLKFSYSLMTSTFSSANQDSIKNEMNKVREFFSLPDLTLLEKKMIGDWIDFLYPLSPPEHAEKWKDIQQTIRNIFSKKQTEGENLEAFIKTNSGFDFRGEPISGRIMLRTLEWRTWETLQIPLTENCNLLCLHCTRTRKFIEKHIPQDEFKTHLAKFSPYKFENILLSDFGEPFLRKDLLNIFRNIPIMFV